MPILDDSCAIVQLTDNMASYITAKYLQSKQLSIAVPIPPGWTEWMKSECDHVIHVILVAVQNQGNNSLDLMCWLAFYSILVSTDWAVDWYCIQLSPHQSGQNLGIEELQEQWFPPIFTRPFPVFMHPNILTDCHGNIIVWHLPDILLEATWVCEICNNEPSWITFVVKPLGWHKCSGESLSCPAEIWKLENRPILL